MQKLTKPQRDKLLQALAAHTILVSRISFVFLGLLKGYADKKL